MDAEDGYEIPLRDQRYFGAGIKRKRINFVPSTTTTTTAPPTKPSSNSAADRYLAVVFNNSEPKSTNTTEAGSVNILDTPVNLEEGVVCPLCHQKVSSVDDKAVHESSIAHQICLEHSHPPSSIDRRRKGLAVLQTQGWDPDARKGLGLQGEGVLHPIKAKENPNRAGLGADPTKRLPKVKPIRLDAGRIKAMDLLNKKKAQDLRNAFYRYEDIERYLGQNRRNTALDLKVFKRSKDK